MSSGYSTMQEEELIRLSKEGDQMAFNFLMKPYKKFIYNVAAKYTDFKEDTEEVVQEAMLKIWLNLPQFRGDSKISTWIYIISANAAKKNLTSRSKIPSHPRNQKISYEETKGITNETERDVSNPPTSNDHSIFGIQIDSPEDILIAGELQDSILKLFDQLADDLFNALYLREIQLLSYEEISEQLDIPLGTCKSRLFNARSMLDMSLKRHLGESSNTRFQVGS